MLTTESLPKPLADSALIPAFQYHPKVRKFIDLVTEATSANGANRLWWYTWLASRDRLNVRLWDRWSRGAGAPSRYSSAWSAAWRFAKWTLRLAEWISAAKLIPRRPRLSDPIDIVLVSVIHPMAVDREGQYSSAFFGKLPHFLMANGRRVLHLGIGEGDPWSTILSLRRANSEVVASFADFVSYADLIGAAITAWRTRFGDLPAELADDARWARADIVQGILIERAMTKILARFPSAGIVHTYENNPWEHACDNAAHDAGRKAIGYLHAAILPSHLKYFATPDDRRMRPAPDLIVCTGPNARRILLSLGDHDETKVVAACALRDEDLRSLPNYDGGRRTIGTVLAILEGLPSMTKALALLDEAARAAPNRKFVVRAHPSLPLDALARLAGISLREGRLHPGLPETLVSSIQQVDVVLYVGSTAVLTAAYMGAPLIKLQLDDTVEDDPLFAAPSVPVRVRTAAEILDAIVRLESGGSYVSAADLADMRTYLLDYLTPPSVPTLAVFLG